LPFPRRTIAHYDRAVRWSWGIVLALCGCEALFTLDSHPAADGPVADGPAPADGSLGDAPPPGGDARADDALPPMPDAQAACPPSYVGVTGSTSRYRKSTLLRTWFEAAADCADDQPGRTHLVVIGNDGERSVVNAALPDALTWIGVSDTVGEGTWLWVTVEAVDADYPPAGGGGPWQSGQPDDGGNGDEDCVAMLAMGDFQDLDCALGVRYICECDAYADEPSHYVSP
jgi:hypothetical protein